MKPLLILVSVIFLTPVFVTMRSDAVPQRSPKDVVEDFWELETHGTRLTPEGWSKTNNFFIRPSPPFSNIIHVISNTDKTGIDETARTENWAEVYVGTTKLGQLDSALRFKHYPERAPNVALLKGPLIKFDLVLTEKHWDLKPDGAIGAELAGPLEWRIVCGDDTPWITVDTAIRYVMGKRDLASDSLVKKNAEATLAELKKLR
jgi:hypothetical protein